MQHIPAINGHFSYLNWRYRAIESQGYIYIYVLTYIALKVDHIYIYMVGTSTKLVPEMATGLTYTTKLYIDYIDI